MAEVVLITLKSKQIVDEPYATEAGYLPFPSPNFVEKMNKKYHIRYYWNFRADGTIGFDDAEGDPMYGKPENHILAFMETCRYYDLNYGGTVSYVWNGNVSTVYIFPGEGKAVVFTLDTNGSYLVSIGTTPLKEHHISL